MSVMSNESVPSCNKYFDKYRIRQHIVRCAGRDNLLFALVLAIAVIRTF